MNKKLTNEREITSSNSRKCCLQRKIGLSIFSIYDEKFYARKVGLIETQYRQYYN